MKRNEERESLCALRFQANSPYFHIWTSENYPIIFTCKEDYVAAMNIMALASRLCPDVRVITFELMSNHLHIVAAGTDDNIQHFLRFLKHLLSMHFKGGRYGGNTSSGVIGGLNFSSRKLLSLKEIRNVIAYDNRNGYLVNPDESPYSYPWGANRYYFNRDANTVYESSCQYLTVKEKRELIFSHMADKIKPVKKVYGYACPRDYCYIDEGEGLFISASQYFHAISKSVESYKTIANELSESIFLTDEEMYSTAASIAFAKYGSKLSDLDNKARLDVAKQLRFDYNSTTKQISRILKLSITIVEAMFSSGR